MEPLAYRMRPHTLDDVVGQEHLTGKGHVLQRMIEAKRLQSFILFGPPGTGKTSIASALAGSFDIPFRQLNAATDSKKDLQYVAEEAKLYPDMILLLDEIHRLDKAKQDFLLPILEKGTLTLIGATTENPYISINPAIRSRIQIFELHPLSKKGMVKLLQRALTDKENGLGNINVTVDNEVLEHLALAMNGDIRSALNTLELAVTSSKAPVHLTDDTFKNLVTTSAFAFDKDGDAHYNLLSAFQKSIRGSDPDAAIYYLARLIVGGDLTSICRRLVITAYEDIGLANPNATQRTLAAVQVAERVGLPEARIPLADAVIDLCLSPKSNSGVKAIDAAIKEVKKGRNLPIPDTICDAHYSGAKDRGHGVDYKYPHDYPNAWVNQQYLPEPIKHQQFYEPKFTGKYERALAQQLHHLREQKK